MFWDAIQPYVIWWAKEPLGLWLGNSTSRIAWLFIFHLFGITLVLGTRVLLSRRLLGFAFKNQPVSELSREVRPYAATGLALALFSGFLIFTGGAEGYFPGEWFRNKMILLTIALVFHFALFRAVIRAEENRFNPILNKITAVLTLVLWFSVGVAGRWIAFF
jgi:uncharacterized membrane protein SirB2